MIVHFSNKKNTNALNAVEMWLKMGIVNLMDYQIYQLYTWMLKTSSQSHKQSIIGGFVQKSLVESSSSMAISWAICSKSIFLFPWKAVLNLAPQKIQAFGLAAVVDTILTIDRLKFHDLALTNICFLC